MKAQIDFFITLFNINQNYIFSGDAACIKAMNGNTTYSGVNVLKVESLGNFSQPGQVLNYFVFTFNLI